jgi:hypothetical protein
MFHLSAGAPRNEPCVCAGRAQRRHHVKRGRSATDHAHVAAFEAAEVAMLGAVRHEARRQCRQFGRHLAEVAQANRNDHAPRRQSFAIVQREVKALRNAFQRDDRLVLEIGHQTLLKRGAIGGESLQRHRAVVVRVSKSVVAAETLERELTLRIVQI